MYIYIYVYKYVNRLAAAHESCTACTSKSTAAAIMSCHI